jgi:hypothetical protein
MYNVGKETDARSGYGAAAFLEEFDDALAPALRADGGAAQGRGR